MRQGGALRGQHAIFRPDGRLPRRYAARNAGWTAPNGITVPSWPVVNLQRKGAVRMDATMIGLDVAKSVFQVHGEDAQVRVVITKRLGRLSVKAFFARLPPVTTGIEACGGAHYWARVLGGLGHTARLLPTAHVKPFVQRNKTDARDAAAICAPRNHKLLAGKEPSIHDRQVADAVTATRPLPAQPVAHAATHDLFQPKPGAVSIKALTGSTESSPR